MLRQRCNDIVGIVIGGGLFFLVTMFTACINEPYIALPENTYISIRVIKDASPQVRAYQGEKIGESLDNVVETIRIMVFSHDDSATVINNLYNMEDYVDEGGVITFQILPGVYDFVFIANEPSWYFVELSMIEALTDLYSVSFPESVFISTRAIPMLQKIENVTVSDNGDITFNEGTVDIHGNQGNYLPGITVSDFALELDRMGVRIDVLLESQGEWSNFQGITLSDIPDVVPLFAAHYPEDTINRGTTRTYNSTYFYEPGTANWSRQLTRTIIPSNNLSDISDGSRAITLTVNGISVEYPSHKLQIELGNYSLPYNTWHTFNGTIGIGDIN